MNPTSKRIEVEPCFCYITIDMSLKYKVGELHHTPQWYHDHCKAEDGGYPAFRGFLTRDMKLIDADFKQEGRFHELEMRIHLLCPGTSLNHHV